MTPEIVTTDSPRSGTARSPHPLTPTNAQLTTGQATPSGNQGQGHENIFRRTLVKSPIIRRSVPLSRSRRPRGITRVGFLVKSAARSAGRWRPRASDCFPISVTLASVSTASASGRRHSNLQSSHRLALVLRRRGAARSPILSRAVHFASWRRGADRTHWVGQSRANRHFFLSSPHVIPYPASDALCNPGLVDVVHRASDRSRIANGSWRPPPAEGCLKAEG